MSDVHTVLEPRLRAPVAVDFETYYDKECSVSSLGVDAYCRHPKFDPYLMSVSDGSEVWVGDPKSFNWSALEGETVVSHNAGFDWQVYLAGVGTRWDAVAFKEWHCTANLSSFLCNRRSLADAVQHLRGRTLNKGVRDRAKGKTVADMKAEGWWDDMVRYAGADAVECQRIFADFGDQWPTFERRLSSLTMRQCQQGVFIDRDRLHTLKEHAQRALIAAETALPWRDSGAKPTSPIAIAEECRKHDIPCPPVKSATDDGEELFDAWVSAHVGRFPWVAAVTAWRRLNKFLGLLDKIEGRLRPDGSMGFELKYFGAHPGRWSGGGGLNMQNFRKIPLLLDSRWHLNLDDDKDVLAAQFFEDTGAWPEWVAHVLDIRGIFIPEPGKKFVISDLSQIEPRCLNWLAGNFKFLDLLKDGMAIYEAHARATMGWSAGNLKKEDKAKYAMAKARVLALGYQAGWEKFIAMAFMYAGIRLDEETSRANVDEFRADNPLITGLWRQLDEQFRASVGGDLSIELPSGRKMRYEKVRRSVRTRQDKKTKEIRKEYEFTADVGGKRAHFYGGKLTENITQATAREVFGEGLLRLEDAGIHTVWTIHDEAVTQVPLDTDPRDVRECLAQTPAWLAGCPIDATAEDADRYKK